MAVAEVFRALGDPVRLEMVRRLSRPEGKPCTIAEVSSGLGITRQGARKHLQVLVDARLAELEPSGRDVLVRLDTESLQQARTYLAEIERQWDTRLAALRRLVEEE
jgi:DNA-binding transcriptional ArsR family regulator